ncbi:hypothetical protein ACFL4T_11980 [candidate division KSB1 bacterium]
MSEFIFTSFLFTLYAEIHSKLPPIPNILNNNIPEIISDTPVRINPGEKIPVLVIVKDSHLYPIELSGIDVEIFKEEEKLQSLKLIDEKIKINQKFWYKVFYITPELKGLIELDVIFSIKSRDKAYRYRNNSYKFIKKHRLKVCLSDEELPDSGRIIYGDLHYHSDYTDDVVEFGAPVDAAVAMAKASGLSFFAVTDHSYDLDDSRDDSHKNDSSLPKWENLQDEIKSGTFENVTVIPGIEVSAGNQKGRNVHLLVLNPGKFYSGSGDSADVWLKNKPDNFIVNILKETGDSELTIAAHPFEKRPFLERLFLRRGTWEYNDIKLEKISGLQILNGKEGKIVKESIRKWTDFLLKGEKKYIYAGNDAHGNFNNLIKLKLPYVLLGQKSEHIFGKMKTGIYADVLPDKNGIIEKLKQGKCFVTTGPSIYTCLYNRDEKYLPGDKTDNNNLKLYFDIKSIKDFGELKSVSIIIGDLMQQKEIKHDIGIIGFNYLYDEKLPFSSLPDKFYLRISCKTESAFALSNPIWVGY